VFLAKAGDADRGATGLMFLEPLLLVGLLGLNSLLGPSVGSSLLPVRISRGLSPMVYVSPKFLIKLVHGPHKHSHALRRLIHMPSQGGDQLYKRQHITFLLAEFGFPRL
jgi:hypothetical protein